MTKPRRLPTKAKAGIEEIAQYLEAMINLARTARQTAHAANDAQTLFLLGQLLDKLHYTLRLVDAVLANPARLDDLLPPAP